MYKDIKAGAMTTKDPLAEETSISAQLTESGLTASAKSRFVAAVDRLCGNIVDRLNVPIEETVAKRRSRLQGDLKIHEAALESALRRIAVDPSLAERALNGEFYAIIRKQENKDAVVNEALADLSGPCPESPGQMGADKPIDPAFLDRFETYAEGASTEELRHRWGRVLASEVRRPGTFSHKVLRVIDELDSDTASAFERLCKNRIVDCVPRCLSGELPFAEQLALVGADLLSAPGPFCQVAIAVEMTLSNGELRWLIHFGGHGVALPNPFPFEIGRGTEDALMLNDEKPAVPVYILTMAGAQIANILPDLQKSVFDALVSKIAEQLPTCPLEIFWHDGLKWFKTRELIPTA
ncbi:DUF2806 domain-containing protein [Novispirillum sp. DQ9]|uniref:DUF2806 domain-containing protein n=1 Tax=Novispirillum sp. DQ9 TaxID=3398612 RepID=UPI003C79D5E5